MPGLTAAKFLAVANSDAVRSKYEPLVEHVAHRADLTYVIGEMISELAAGRL